MSDPAVESMAEVRSHLADVIDSARREENRRSSPVDIPEYQRLRRIAKDGEDAWLSRLADEAESEGTEGSVSLEEMAALFHADQA
ncbi:prevent-host-death family protein [Streptomyces sp. NBS 14/10]|uniref:prevent-host-death family protein n=1 Tax=Streptomyces sp. NBS 14/10 TaxID=1945643 RepID=UPI000B7EA3ED|nr:prevent-host-death family protein [Streptomyces sp. NBS 14/10]KAK1182682.1 prevent-host-death family protein [Streptomyces sp. NBS 14/10]